MSLQSSLRDLILLRAYPALKRRAISSRPFGTQRRPRFAIPHRTSTAGLGVLGVAILPTFTAGLGVLGVAILPTFTAGLGVLGVAISPDFTMGLGVLASRFRQEPPYRDSALRASLEEPSPEASLFSPFLKARGGSGDSRSRGNTSSERDATPGLKFKSRRDDCQ